MERIAHENGTSTYLLDDGRTFRIHLQLVTSPEALATGDRIEVITRGYQLDADGGFVTNADGEPVTIKEQRAIIPMGNIRNKSASVKPGWLLLPDDLQTPTTDEDDASLLNEMDTGTEGQIARLDDGFLYRWTEGEYELIRQRRLADAPPAPQPALPPAVVAGFAP